MISTKILMINIFLNILIGLKVLFPIISITRIIFFCGLASRQHCSIVLLNILSRTFQGHCSISKLEARKLVELLMVHLILSGQFSVKYE